MNAIPPTSAREIHCAKGFLDDAIGVLDRRPFIVGSRGDPSFDPVFHRVVSDTAAPPPRAARTGVAVVERRIHPHQLGHVSSRARGHTGQQPLRPAETHISLTRGHTRRWNSMKASPDSPLISESGPSRKLDLPSIHSNERSTMNAQRSW